MRWRGPVSERSITLIKDARNSVPLPTPRTGSVLYLSVLDYPSGWRIAAPSRTVIPELKARWANTESVEISDRTTPSELDLVRAMADNYDAVVAGVFVRASSGSGRLDLAPPVVRAAAGPVARQPSGASQPFVAVFFGNPYTPMFVPEIPAMMLTYDFSDYAEASAVKALAGEIAIGGKLPIALPGLFPLGHGYPPLDASRRSLAAQGWRRLRFGVHVLFPRQQLLTHPPDDRGVRRGDVVALAEVLAHVEQHDARGALEQQLPVAVADRALIEAGRRDAPEQRA